MKNAAWFVIVMACGLLVFAIPLWIKRTVDIGGRENENVLTEARQRGRERADSDWAAHRAVIYDQTATGSRRNDLKAGVDPESGLPLADGLIGSEMSQEGLAEIDGYSERLRELLPEQKSKATANDRSANSDALPAPTKDASVPANPLRAAIAAAHFDSKCQLLLLRVEFFNDGAKPIFVVANEFVFMSVGGLVPYPGPNLIDEPKLGLMTIDLSHPVLNPERASAIRGDWVGSLGTVDQVVEIDPKSIRNARFVFQFPLSLDKYGDSDPGPREAEAPRPGTRIALRFGWATESSMSFAQREIKPGMTVEKWQQHLTQVWQRTLDTAPVLIDYKE